jgi:hypothetical protein
LVDEAAESGASLDGGGWGEDGTDPRLGRFGWCEIERAVRPVGVVMVDEDAEYTFEVAAVEDQEPVEAFGSDGADEALGDRVGKRR